MAIKYNPYNWDIRDISDYCPKKDDMEQIRKDLVDELYDAANQPYIIEEDIDFLIEKLYRYQTTFMRPQVI